MAEKKTPSGAPGFGSEAARSPGRGSSGGPKHPSQSGTAAQRKREVQTFGAPSPAARRKAGTLPAKPTKPSLASRAKGAFDAAEEFASRIPERPDTASELAAVAAASRGSGPASTQRRVTRQSTGSRLRSGVRPQKRRRSTRRKGK